METTEELITCPGCSVRLPNQHLPSSGRFDASEECIALFHELSYFTLSLRDEFFLHQNAVDAYEAQHAGGNTKNITAAFGLIGLYLTLEKGYTGKEVQKAHMLLAKQSKTWPKFSPPSVRWGMTVHDVVQARTEERAAKIRDWAKAVWDGWKDHHCEIAALTAKYLHV